VVARELDEPIPYRLTIESPVDGEIREPASTYKKNEVETTEPPCLSVLAGPWTQYLFAHGGYKGYAIAGIRRLLAAHCIFHTDCLRCREELDLEYRNSHNQPKVGAKNG